MDSPVRVLVNAIPMVMVNTGISRYLRCLYSNLERLYGNRLQIGYFDGVRVSSKMPDGPADLNRWAKRVDLFWELPVVPAFMLRVMFQWMREALFRMHTAHYDIYHEAGFFPFAVPRKMKTVFTVHDLSLMRFPHHHPRERVLYSRLFFQRRCKTVDRFLSVSRFTSKEMQCYLGVDPEEISITPEAHDPSVFYGRSSREVASFLHRRGLPARYFLFVGGGDPRKNLDVVSEAVADIGMDVPLVTVGWSGWSEREQQEDRISLGYVSDDDLARLYSGAVGLVFPSSYEGFGLPILEAMACGCPVVAARKASLQEVAGEAALYVHDPRNRVELGNVLKMLLLENSIRNELVRKGRLQAEKFSWEDTAHETFRAFLQVLEG